MTDWGNGVPLDLGTLAIDAISCPSSDVGSHAGPNKFGCHGLSGAFHARVPKAVDDVENSFAPRLRDERSGGSVADIYDDVSTSDIHFLEVES